MRMAQIRKEARRKNKIEFARVKKINERILAGDESRQQVTYQRLYEQGTLKLQKSRFGQDSNVNYNYNEDNIGETYLSPSKSTDLRFGRQSIVDAPQ